MNGIPHIQFYVGDWRKDPAVQSLSYHHRGIWQELLMFMHESADRGRLVWSGKPMTNSGIARLLGVTERESADAISVLLDAGVASRDESGAIICRRMVRENQISQTRKKSACKRWCKTHANGHAKPMQNTDIDNDIGSLSSLEKKNKAASLEELQVFCREIGLPKSDAEWFWHKCEANGWRNGGEPIRDWRQTLRSWKAAGYVPSIKNPRKGVPPPAGKRETKPQPAGWHQWLATVYPEAVQRDYWRAPADVQQEFQQR